METRRLLPAVLCLILGGLTACNKPSGDDAQQPGVEHIDAEERAIAAKLRPTKDPIQEEIYAYRLQVRQAYNNRRFDELETQAAQARRSRALFGNGTWRISEFYESFGCRDEEPESMWQLHDRIHQDWIAAKPTSIAARVAHAGFQADYAWHARGSDFADKVTADGWRRFEERLTAAQKILLNARGLAEKDPMWWRVGLRVALGANLPRENYNRLVAEAVAFEPAFWTYDTARAYSLLPRWHGKPGEWELYAADAAKRPGGLGNETYARVVISLHGFYDNIFRETQASWPLTRAGIEQMLKKYPTSLELLSASAKMATLAEDRPLAKQLYDQIGDRYLPNTWRKPERFAHYRHWAQTGQW